MPELLYVKLNLYIVRLNLVANNVVNTLRYLLITQ